MYPLNQKGRPNGRPFPIYIYMNSRRLGRSLKSGLAVRLRDQHGLAFFIQVIRNRAVFVFDADHIKIGLTVSVHTGIIPTRILIVFAQHLAQSIGNLALSKSLGAIGLYRRGRLRSKLFHTVIAFCQGRHVLQVYGRGTGLILILLGGLVVWGQGLCLGGCCSEQQADGKYKLSLHSVVRGGGLVRCRIYPPWNNNAIFKKPPKQAKNKGRLPVWW